MFIIIILHICGKIESTIILSNYIYSTHRDENENVHPNNILYYDNNFIFIGPSGT